MISKILKTLLILQMTVLPYFAEAKELVSSFDMLQAEAMSRYTSGNEFISGQDPGVVMMKVNLWGAVRKPGIHHIPVKTDLIALISYGGGPADNAMIDEITIKRIVGGNQKVIHVDLKEVIGSDKKYDLVLQPDDTIIVPTKKPLIDQEKYMLATFFLALASAVLTVIVIGKQNKSN